MSENKSGNRLLNPLWRNGKTKMATRFPMIIVNTAIPIVVQMTPNPKNISIESAKVFSKTMTLGGWVFEHWGEQPQTIRVEGRTIALSGDFDNELSVEAVLFKLQQIYRMDKREMLSLLPIAKALNPFDSLSAAKKWKEGIADSDTLRTLANTYIYYKYDAYAGFFTRFRWSQDAETTPRHYEYDFEFLATKTAQNWLADTLFAPQTRGVARAAVTASIGLAASVPAVVNTIKGFINMGKNLTSGKGLKSV